MKIDYRRPTGRKTGLAKDPQALRVLARAQAMRDAVLAVAIEGDTPRREDSHEAAPDPKRPWCDWTKMAINPPGMLSLQSRE